MAGETILADAICLAIRPWSKTSHVVEWLSRAGRIATLVKGAVRPKSAFLGQYDLNYTCEILYYARARGDLHALRECSPIKRRDELRHSYRSLALADYFRSTVRELAPSGPDCAEWFEALEGALDALMRRTETATAESLKHLLSFEMRILELSGLTPDLEESSENGSFQLRGERRIPVTRETLECIRDPMGEKNLKILVDAARVIGVFYTFHLDCAPDVRRTVLRMISTNE
jgi:DNA repair protein RecO